MKSIRDVYVGPQLPKVECKFAIVGEAPSEEEALQVKPFINKDGRMLRYTCAEVGLNLDQALMTYVFRHKPPQTAKRINDASVFFMKRAEAKKVKKETGWVSPYPIKHSDGYLRPEHEQDLHDLYAELEKYSPDIVICLGAFALWALTGEDKVGTYRGTVIPTTLPSGKPVKVMGTYLPLNVMRNWSNRYHFFHDLVKAKGEIGSKHIKRTPREIWVEPTLQDVGTWIEKYLPWNEGGPNTPPLLSVDIETDGRLKQITCVGMSVDETHALVIPFVDMSKPSGSYWDNPDDEWWAWHWIGNILSSEEIPKVFQNGTYDMFWFMWQMRIPTLGRIEDTMHAHHAMEPELPKSLGALSSIYINETPWKTLVTHGQENKRDN